MIKIAIIDDQKPQIELFQALVNDFFSNEIEVLCTYTSPKDAFKTLKNNSIDILFCDIDMPEINGLELLDLIAPYKFKVIMLTGHDTYALSAIKHHVFDYLLKPINVLAISESIKKYNDSLNNTPKNTTIQDAFDDKLIVNGHEKVVVMATKDIVRFEASGAYTTIFYEGNKSVITSKPIGFYEQQLESKGFYKIHRSHLINIKHIKELLKDEGEGVLILSNNEKLNVSKLKKNELVNLLTNR